MDTKYKIISSIAIFLLLLTGLNAAYSGVAFIMSPNGSLLGLSVDRLRFSPFSNFLIPGIILLLVIGIFNCIVALLIILKKKHHPFLVLFQGIVLIGWIVVQIIMIQEMNGLHLTMICIGILLILAGMALHSEKS